MPTLHEIRHELETWLPAYKFKISKGLFGRRIVVKNANGHGALIFIKGDKIVVEAIGPGLISRLTLGSGGAFKKFSDEHYTETAEKVYNFLGREYTVELRK